MAPDEIEIAPLLPDVAVPVCIQRAPLAPGTDLAADAIVTSPLAAEDELVPLEREIDPPVPPLLVPAWTTIAPPPAPPLPDEIDTWPPTAAVAVAVPDVIVSAPPAPTDPDPT